jgi:hypothetical protein
MKSFRQLLEENTANPYIRRATEEVLGSIAQEHILQDKNAKKHGVNTENGVGDFVSAVVEHFRSKHDLNDYTLEGHSKNAENALKAHGIKVPKDLMDRIARQHELHERGSNA